MNKTNNHTVIPGKGAKRPLTGDPAQNLRGEAVCLVYRPDPRLRGDDGVGDFS